MKPNGERLISTVFALSITVIAVAFAHREFAPGDRRTQPPRPTTYVEHWEDVAASGIREGEATAPVQVMVFSDMECPFCRMFDLNFRILRAQFPSQITLIYVPFLIPGHRFAMSAARATECANNQERFTAFYHLVFDKQDSLGLKSWPSYAKEAGVRNARGFARCVTDTMPVSRVGLGREAGRKIGVDYTPTVIINGWKLGSPPDSAELSRIVGMLLKGKSPFPVKARILPR